MALDTRTKKLLSRLFKSKGRERLVESLIDEPRVMYDSWDSWKVYGFVTKDEIADGMGIGDGRALQRDDIDQWFDECVRVKICSPYDCTGKPFTVCIDWHINPCGLISYVHEMALDV